MPKGRKRTEAEYEREIEEAAKRIKKHKEGLTSARDSEEWLEFLQDKGITTTDSKEGQDFWEKVRDKMPVMQRREERKTGYEELREAGIPADIARQARDWGSKRREEFIINWQSKN